MVNTQKQILFVYNANASLFAQLTDYAHKILRPETYPCSLCKLTYGNLGMNQEWKAFIKNLPYTITFLHKDEFGVQYPEQEPQPLPAVFEIVDGQVYQNYLKRN